MLNWGVPTLPLLLREWPFQGAGFMWWSQFQGPDSLCIPFPSCTETSMAYHCVSCTFPLLACEFNPSCRRHVKCFIQQCESYPVRHIAGGWILSWSSLQPHTLPGAQLNVGLRKCLLKDRLDGRTCKSSGFQFRALTVTQNHTSTLLGVLS